MSDRGKTFKISEIMVGSFQDCFCLRYKFLHSKRFARAIVFLQD
jgi:hypothetical protein